MITITAYNWVPDFAKGGCAIYAHAGRSKKPGSHIRSNLSRMRKS